MQQKCEISYTVLRPKMNFLCVEVGVCWYCVCGGVNQLCDPKLL